MDNMILENGIHPLNTCRKGIDSVGKCTNEVGLYCAFAKAVNKNNLLLSVRSVWSGVCGV